jgi:hypothetical protein
LSALNQNNFEFTTTDGTLFEGVSWIHDETPKAIIAIAYGLASIKCATIM